MAGRKKKRAETPCAHVGLVLIAYMGGAPDHWSAHWCPDCGALVRKRQELGKLAETVLLPRKGA